MSTFRYRASAEFVFDVQADTKEQADEKATEHVRKHVATGPDVGFYALGRPPYMEPELDRTIREIDRIGGLFRYELEPLPLVNSEMYFAVSVFIRGLPSNITLPSQVKAKDGHVIFEWSGDEATLGFEFTTPDTIHYHRSTPWTDGEVGVFPASEISRAVELIRWFVDKKQWFQEGEK